MPPKQSTKSRGRPKATTASRSSKVQEPQSSNPFESSDEEPTGATGSASRSTRDVQVVDDASDDGEPAKTIPRDLLTRILHEFFAKDATRLSKDANAAVGKYMDIFVREAIARAAIEKDSGFLEVQSNLDKTMVHF